MAAAIGSGLPIHEPVGNMVIDVGGGTAETAMVSMGGIVSLKAIRVGSFDFDAALQNYATCSRSRNRRTDSGRNQGSNRISMGRSR